MFGLVTGTVMDTINLMDLLESHLFGANDHILSDSGRRRIDHNMVLGISLGGHSAWQLLFADPRVTAGVIVIGCPDYMGKCRPQLQSNKRGMAYSPKGEVSIVTLILTINSSLERPCATVTAAHI